MTASRPLPSPVDAPHAQELTDEAIRELLRQRIERAGSLRAEARNLRISPAYLCDIMHGRRQPGRSVCERLGIEKRVEVIRIESYTFATMRSGTRR